MNKVPGQTANILVVDDVATNRELAKRILVSRGFEVCRRIRQQATTSHIPVVMLSASDESTDVVSRTSAAGATSYLAKPFAIDELIRVVAEALECQ